MNTWNNLYPDICAFANLLAAARAAQRGKRFRPDVFDFHARLEENLLCLQDELIARTWQPGPYRLFHVQEAKRRLISAAPYRDRVVHHALCNVRRARYVLKCDISRYWMKERMGCRFYIRYVDDFLIMDDDKRRLHALVPLIEEQLDAIGLALHPRQRAVFPVSEGCDFMGYRIWPTHRRVRPFNGYRYQRRLATLARMVQEGRADFDDVHASVACGRGGPARTNMQAGRH